MEKLTILNKKKSLDSWFRILLGKFKFSIVFSSIIVLSQGFFLIFQAWILSKILHASIVLHIPRNELFLSIFHYSILLFFRIFLFYLSEVINVDTAENIKFLVRKSLINQLLKKNLQWFREQSSGILASTITDQVEAMDGYFSKYLSASVNAVVIPLAYSVLIFPIDWLISLLLLVTLPLIPIFMFLIGKGTESVSRRNLRIFARLSGLFSDRLRGLETLKLYGRASDEVQTISNASQQLRRSTLSILKISFLSSAILELFSALSIAGIAIYIGLNYLGFLSTLSSSFSLHSGLFCLFLVPEVYFPLRKLATHYHDRASAMAAARQIEILFSTLPQIHSKNDLMICKRKISNVAYLKNRFIPIGISVSNLYINSSKRQTSIIENANFRIIPGQHIALMGSSGSGKTSLLESLVKLRDFSGQIYLNGISVKNWNENVLRESVYLVTQRPYLFSGSISENIALGQSDVSAESIRNAARIACVSEFTENFLNGIDTILGQGGFGISMGQAQRIAIARLFLRDPGLILMDEPTAHLDGKTQNHLLKGILSFAKSRTLLLVTHSHSVARNFPTIWRLSRGGISVDL